MFPERKYIRIIFLFFMITFFQLVIALLSDFLIDPQRKLNGRNKYINIAGYIYLVLEYLIYIYLLQKFIKSQLVKIYLRISLAIILPLWGFLWVSDMNVVRAISIFTLIESLIILGSCFYFFYELLKYPPLFQLNKEPAFWIVTGITFLFICLIPVYLGLLILGTIESVQAIDYIGYMIIIVLFLKGILCNPAQTG
jgi:hypothetical protein